MNGRNLPTVPRLTAPLDQGDVDALMRSLRQLQDFAQRLPVWTAIETTIQAPTAAEFRVATGLQKAPKSVIVGRMVQTAPTYGPTSIPGSLQWTFDGGDLVLPDFASMAGTGTYLVRLLIEEG